MTFLTTTTEDIFLNLTSGIGSLPAGDTFSLVFSYDINGDGVVNSPTFTSLAAADAYFNGMAIDLGNFDAGTQSLDLTYAFTAMGDPPSYEVTYDIAGTSVAPTVPEPSTWAMMLIGFGGLGYIELAAGEPGEGGGGVIVGRSSPRTARPPGPGGLRICEAALRAGLLELLDGPQRRDARRLADDALERRAMRVAPSSGRARKTPRGLASGVVARRSKRVLSRLFRLKKKLPCQIFGLMGS